MWAGLRVPPAYRLRAWQQAEAVKDRPAIRGEMGAGGVAVEDLGEERVDGGDRVEEPFPPPKALTAA